MEQPDVAASSIVGEIRARVRRPWAPSPRPDPLLSPMTADPNLGYLHRHWELRKTLEPARQRVPAGGVRGAVKVAFNRLNLGSLAPYLDEEQELLAHLVRLVDALAHRCDAIVAAQAAEIDSLRADLVELAARIEAAQVEAAQVEAAQVEAGPSADDG
jgi:hypothetical protein